MKTKLNLEDGYLYLSTGNAVPFDSSQCQSILEESKKFICERGKFKATCRAIPRKESQYVYWEVYKKIGSKIKKRYLGRTEAISIELLSDVLDYLEGLYKEYKQLKPPSPKPTETKITSGEDEEKRFTVAELRKLLENKKLKKDGRSYQDKKRLIDELEQLK